jgi:sterol desaturase/sphingolipid hydroxylase (fatty acid hydroxylase superfamily)
MKSQERVMALAHAITKLLAGTALLAGLFYLLERLFPERPTQPAFRKGTKVDFIYWFFDFFVSRRIAAATSIVVVIAAVALRMPRLSLVSHQWLGVQALEALLVIEFFSYWSHRMLHEIPLLWRLHKVHHSSEQLDWLAAARAHPLEAVWNRIIVLLPLFVLGFSPTITAFYGPLIALYPIFLHSNVRWSYGWFGHVIASPAFHRWHHSSDPEALNTNYSGLLPVFDSMFGTAHFPHYKPHAFGLAGEPTPPGFWAQLTWPFRTSQGQSVR